MTAYYKMYLHHLLAISLLLSPCLAGFLPLSEGDDDMVMSLEDAPKTRKGIFRNYGRPESSLGVEDDSADVGKALFISPLLDEGKIKEARNLSRVHLPNDPQNTVSFSGYLTVDKKYDSNMFFWFFPSKVSPSSAPLVIWLQGGPGGSSMFGLFGENGPFNADKDMNLVYRKYSWTNTMNVLYFDNPVGTGFSFTRDDAGYATNEVQVGENLYSAIQQFLTLFPELRKNELYITGESYAGKYVPAITYTIHKKNPDAEKKINLRGMAIGDGLCDPVTMTDYGSVLYDLGLIDETQMDVFENAQAEIVDDIEKGNWKKAFEGFDMLLNGDTTEAPSLFTNYTGLTFYYNYMMDKEPEAFGYYYKYLNLPSIRKAIHVGNMTFNDGVAVEQHLMEDVMQSVKPWIEEILNQPEYKIMIYNGQLDIIIAYELTRNFVESMKWNGSDAYAKADRKIWKVDGKVAGYVKETPNFVEVLIRGAGHMVPYDQPKNSYDMITRFVSEGGFTDV